MAVFLMDATARCILTSYTLILYMYSDIWHNSEVWVVICVQNLTYVKLCKNNSGREYFLFDLS